MCSGGAEESYADPAMHAPPLHHQRAVARGDRTSVQCFSASVIRLCGARAQPRARPTPKIRGVGPEFNDRMARALRRPRRDDLLARGKELGVHLLATEGMLVVGRLANQIADILTEQAMRRTRG
jgi:hypothetical protein